ncbi:MAG: ribosome maturation factor RimP [Proteobacteria bacterium]|nr:ribosome maturation factor RimP [Pseudomonadota bacterium]
MKEKLLSQMIEPIVTDLGFVFWGLEYLLQKNSAMLRVYIDHENGVSVSDCAKCSREISGVLEVEDPIKVAYTLELSSPGMDRVLFNSKQYEQYIGETVKVKLAQPVDGARNIKGNIIAVNETQVTIDNGSVKYMFDIGNVMKARLKPKFGGVKK